MNQHSSFKAPVERLDLPSHIAEFHAKRDGGEITREKPYGTLEVITTHVYHITKQ